MKNERFEQLMALAVDGDEAAPGDLWLEFGYRFHSGVVGDEHDAD